jgi:predicted RNase H-like HicB family nuclease
MLTEYIRAAMSRAEYEDLDDEGWFGHITSPGFQGVWASGRSPEDARNELQSVLEDWILIRLHRGQPLPIVDGIDLNVKDVA